MPARLYHAVRHPCPDKEKVVSRKTAVLILAAVVLFYILLQDLRTPPEREVRKQRFIYHIDPESIREVTIIKNGKPHISGTRIDEENWVLTKPVETRAAAFAFAPVQNFISIGKYLLVVTKEGVPDFSFEKYGLDDPPVTVMFTAEDKRYGFDVSPVFDEKLFVRKHGEEDRVYAVPPHFYNYFNRPVSEYRPSTVFSFNDTNVRRLELKGARHFLVAKPPRGIWHIREPFMWPCASDIIADYLKRMKALRITAFAKDSAEDKDFKEYGIMETSPSLAVVLRDGTVQSIRLGRKEMENGKEIYYFTANDSDSVYSADAYPIDILFEADLKVFRSRKLAVFSNAQITKLTVDDLSDKPAWRIVLERDKITSPWKCTEPEGEQVGTSRVNEFIEDFLNTDVVNFTMEGKDKIKVFDLDSPDMVITFYARDRAGGDRKIYRLNLKNKGKNQIYGYIDADVYGSITILRIPSELYAELDSGLAAFKPLYIIRGARDRISWFAVSGVNRVRFEARLTPENTWKVVEPTDKEVNHGELFKTLAVLADLRTEKIVTLSTENYSVYGFDSPQAVVSFVAFGKKYKILIGKTMPGTTHSYVKVDTSPIVYALGRNRMNELTKDTGMFIKNKE